MKATELIQKLQKLVEKYGDLQILTEQEGMGGEALFTTEIHEGSIYTLYASHVGEVHEPSFETVKELFPDFPINEGQEFYDVMENYDGDDRCNYIKLVCGEMVYAD